MQREDQDAAIVQHRDSVALGRRQRERVASVRLRQVGLLCEFL
jgi:hypothetical protein